MTNPETVAAQYIAKLDCYRNGKTGPKPPTDALSVLDERGVLYVPAHDRYGWHSLRRKFASEFKAIPLKDLAHLGGWKDPATILKCYQTPDEATQRAALEQRQSLCVGGLTKR